MIFASPAVAYQAVVPRWEGEYVTNNHGDDGGVTVYGISLAHNPNWEGAEIVLQIIEKANGDYTLVNAVVKSNEKVQGMIKDFYSNLFCSIMLDKLYSQNKANMIFQSHILWGGLAIEWAQMVCMYLCSPEIEVDLLMGNETIKSINDVDEDDFLRKFCMLQEQFSRYRSRAKPENMQYKEGWIARCRAFLPREGRQ